MEVQAHLAASNKSKASWRSDKKVMRPPPVRRGEGRICFWKGTVEVVPEANPPNPLVRGGLLDRRTLAEFVFGVVTAVDEGFFVV